MLCRLATNRAALGAASPGAPKILLCFRAVVPEPSDRKIALRRLTRVKLFDQIDAGRGGPWDPWLATPQRVV